MRGPTRATLPDVHRLLRRRRPIPPVSGRSAFAIVLVLSTILAAGSLPLISLETARDWRTYADAAAHLQAGLPLSFTGGALVNLYPPAMALLWTIGLSGLAWFGLSLASCGALGVMGRRIEAPALVLLTLLQVPVLYDLLIGNVMTLYAASIAVCLVVTGWVGAIPLGVLFALAAKPALLPLIAVLLAVRRSDGLRVLAVAAAVSLAALAVVGIGPYAEYARALLAAPAYLAGWTTGNLGTGRLGLAAAAAGVLAGALLTVVAIRRLPSDLAFAVALGASCLVQPTLGLPYGTLLIPACVLLWREHRLVGLVATIAAIAGTVAISPVVGGVVIASLAFVVPLERTVADPAPGPLARYHPVPVAPRPAAPPEALPESPSRAP